MKRLMKWPVLAAATIAILGFWYYYQYKDTGIKATWTATPECLGQANGSISITASSPSGTVQCVWSSANGTVNGATGTVLNGLGVGTYTATLSVPGTSVADKVLTVEVGGQRKAETIVQQPTKLFDNSGSIVVDVRPSGTYGYAWADAPGQNTAQRTNLGPGVYTVAIDAGTGCSRSFTVKLVPAFSDPTYCASWKGAQANVLTLDDWTDTGGGSLPQQLGFVNGQMSGANGKVFQVGDCTHELRFTKASALLGYLMQHGQPPTVIKPFGHGGTVIDQWNLVGRNDLAAQLLVLQMNMAMPNAGSLILAAPALGDTRYIGHPFHLERVADIHTAIDRALGCGEDASGAMLTPAQLEDMHRVLVEINDHGRYLTCADL